MSLPLADLVEAHRRVDARSGRLEKIGVLADLLRRAGPTEVGIVVAYLSGELPQGRIGVGGAAIRDAHPGEAADRPSLTVADVDVAFTAIAGTTGAGSVAARGHLLRELLIRSTRPEQDFLARLLFGELRQGAQEGVMLDAVARGAGVPARAVRRAHMFTGDIGRVARVAFREGAPGLARFGLEIFRPVRPMLAGSADDVDEALSRHSPAAFDLKLDGARVQVHRSGDEVAVFTRTLNDVTGAVPELVEAVLALPARDLVLDGEVLALREDGRPYAFQATMRRFGRKLDVDAMRRELPLSSFFFDVLHLEGETLVDLPGRDRFVALESAVPEGLRVPRILTADPEEAADFLAAARAAGHEGVMAKDPEAPYQAGRRGKGWLKIKPAHSLDLVVLAAEWGHGRRRGWLSNLHLGARDPDTGGFVMLGKTFKGLTDELLAWQTRALQEIEVARDRHTVHVEPRLVVEVAFNDVQASPRYPGGMALRFARVKGYRPDKRPDEADTIDSVRAIFEAQGGIGGLEE